MGNLEFDFRLLTSAARRNQVFSRGRPKPKVIGDGRPRIPCYWRGSLRFAIAVAGRCRLREAVARRREVEGVRKTKALAAGRTSAAGTAACRKQVPDAAWWLPDSAASTQPLGQAGCCAGWPSVAPSGRGWARGGRWTEATQSRLKAAARVMAVCKPGLPVFGRREPRRGARGRAVERGWPSERRPADFRKSVARRFAGIFRARRPAPTERAAGWPLERVAGRCRG
jgi:hypothetical protein